MIQPQNISSRNTYIVNKSLKNEMNIENYYDASPTNIASNKFLTFD